MSAQIGNMISKAKSVVGTPLFMSPEVLDGANYNTKASTLLPLPLPILLAFRS